MQKGRFSGSYLTNGAKAGGGMSMGPLEAERSGWVDEGGYRGARSFLVLWEFTLEALEQ